MGDDYGTYYWTGPGQIAVENLEGDDSRVIMDRVVPFIRAATRADDPFLAVVWFHSPHEPVVGGPTYREQYAHRREAEQHYYGTITAIDEQIGRLRTELADLGLADETMLWFCSDNDPAAEGGGPGWHRGLRQQGETGRLRGRKGTLYEGGIRMPGTLVWPAMIDGGRTVNLPCVTSDYYPTVFEALGIEPPHDQPWPIDGVSLFPLIAGEMTARPDPIGFQSPGVEAVIDNEHKLIRTDDAAWELYDLDADPYETEELAAEHPARVAELRDWFADWRSSCEDSKAGHDYAS